MIKSNSVTIAIDPATGVSSPTGVAVIHDATNTILGTYTFPAKEKKLEHRIKRISEGVEGVVNFYSEHFDVRVFIEYFIMRGKGGEMLQRLIGSIMGRVPLSVPIKHVHNITLKKVVAGDGHADKAAVGQGVLRHFSGHLTSEPMVSRLILLKRWDELDSLAIGIAGMAGHGANK